MRGALVKALASDPRLADVAEPVVRDGETLVEIDAVAVAHLDLTVAAGQFAVAPPCPYVPGTDGSGRVVASSAFEPGTRVWIRGGGVGLSRDGCWAERVAVPDDAVHVVTHDVPPALAATFFVPCSTAQLALHDLGALERGGRVGVRGAAGAVGSVAVQLALAAGAADVVAIVRTPDQAARVPEGARVVVAPDPADVATLAGAELDVVVDTVGGPGVAALVPAVRAGGRIVLVGYVGGLVAEFTIPTLIGHDVRLVPANGLRHETRLFDRAPELLAGLADGTLRLPVREHPLERLDEAVADLRRGGGRVALVF